MRMVINPELPVVSVVVPVYGCRNCLAELVDRLRSTLQEFPADYEIILVNDRSPDGAWTAICELASADPKLKGILFSRNFGQHYAVTAGLDYASGDFVAVMDCDLQDRPEDVPLLLRKVICGADIAYGYSRFRGRDSFVRTCLRRVYFQLFDFLSGARERTVNLSFCLMKRKVRDSLVQYREFSRHIAPLIRDVGFTFEGVEVTHLERTQGKSSYTFVMRVKLAIEGLVVYSAFLLRLGIYAGFLISLASFGFAAVVIYNRLFQEDHYPGWASLAVMVLFSTGITIFLLGIMGIYLEKIFAESRKRPLYIVDEKVNL